MGFASREVHMVPRECARHGRRHATKHKRASPQAGFVSRPRRQRTARVGPREPRHERGGRGELPRHARAPFRESGASLRVLPRALRVPRRGRLAAFLERVAPSPTARSRDLLRRRVAGPRGGRRAIAGELGPSRLVHDSWRFSRRAEGIAGPVLQATHSPTNGSRTPRGHASCCHDLGNGSWPRYARARPWLPYMVASGARQSGLGRDGRHRSEPREGRHGDKGRMCGAHILLATRPSSRLLDPGKQRRAAKLRSRLHIAELRDSSWRRSVRSPPVQRRGIVPHLSHALPDQPIQREDLCLAPPRRSKKSSRARLNGSPHY